MIYVGILTAFKQSYVGQSKNLKKLNEWALAQARVSLHEHGMEEWSEVQDIHDLQKRWANLGLMSYYVFQSENGVQMTPMEPRPEVFYIRNY